jgi:hypothetical protein
MNVHAFALCGCHNLNLFKHKVQIHCHPLHVYALAAIVGNIKMIRHTLKMGKLNLNMHH